MSSSARRALRILESVGKAEGPVGVTEIGRRLAVTAGTVFRSLDALERGGYIARYQSSARYVLGATVSRLRQSIFARFPIREICLPYLRQLAFASGETTSLTVPVGWYALRLAAAPGTNEVTTSSSLGEVRPLAASSAGKAILAFQPAERSAGYVLWARRHGGRTPAPDTLEAELRGIRRRGFMVEETAFASGRASLAVPVRQGERAIAAITVEGPVLHLDHPLHDDLERWLEIVRTIEALARARPALFENPFDHLDADDIVLKLVRS